jgi:guanylate kinase
MSSAPFGTLVVIAAPSGAGKSTLVDRLLLRVPDVSFSISSTTRAPRRGEVDGVAYHFIDETKFRAKIEREDFLEWAEVHGHLYGTGRSETLAQLHAGRDVLLDIDVQGASQVRASGLPALSVFILPPDADTLRDRLVKRATESPDALARRLARAREEVAEFGTFDYLIINDDVDAASEELVSIVRAARCRRDRRTARAVAIVGTFGPDFR